MRVAEETWSLGVKIGLPVAIVLFLICFGLFVAFSIARVRAEDSYNRGDWTFAAFCAFASALAVLLISTWAFWPLEKEYHRWYPVMGKVEQIERRILNSGNGISERVLIEIEGKGQYGCDDTRCTGLKEGDQVSLTCKLEWQYTGTDGYSCNYIDSAQK